MSINFNGNCREAVLFYAGVFHQEVPHFLTYSEGDTSFDPNFQVSEDMKDLIMNTSLNIAGTIVEFSDMPDTFEFIRGNSMFLTVICQDPEEARKVFVQLSENGQAAVPFSQIPGQGWYGMVSDKYQLGWILKA